MSTTHGFPSAARVRAAQRHNGNRRIDVKAVLGLEREGCLGNCRQGRDPCTLPGVCGAPRVRAPLDARPICAMPFGIAAEPDTGPDTMPGCAPAPAEACTELGMPPREREAARDVGLRRRFWLAYLGGMALAGLWLWLH